MVYDDALREMWIVVPDGSGGAWDIISDHGNIVAHEIPHGILANHIITLHNKQVESDPVGERCFVDAGTHVKGCALYKEENASSNQS